MRKPLRTSRIISIHAPREGCDGLHRRYSLAACANFNPRTPRGVRRYPTSPRRISCTDFNPRTPRGVRLLRRQRPRGLRQISIHAPREGCDGHGPGLLKRQKSFQSTHPARGATTELDLISAIREFQSTHPARGATHHQVPSIAGTRFQSTHPARGATGYQYFYSEALQISIHAPREGCDRHTAVNSKRINVFQSTHPARGATYCCSQLCQCYYDFNPRTPRGVRPRF